MSKLDISLARVRSTLCIFAGAHMTSLTLRRLLTHDRLVLRTLRDFLDEPGRFHSKADKSYAIRLIDSALNSVLDTSFMMPSMANSMEEKCRE